VRTTAGPVVAGAHGGPGRPGANGGDGGPPEHGEQVAAVGVAVDDGELVAQLDVPVAVLGAGPHGGGVVEEGGHVGGQFHE
jgi:hypothetical protein